MAEKHDRTVLRSTQRTAPFMSSLISRLYSRLAPEITRSGVMLEVYGEGILIQGESGVGKSEVAIELLKRGHRLVADDAVEIKETSRHTLMATSPELIRGYMELRGIGVIDIGRLLGMGAIKLNQEIDLVVNLEPWDDKAVYDRFVSLYRDSGGEGPCGHYPGKAGPESGQHRGGSGHEQPQPEDGPQRGPGADGPDG